LKKLKKGKFCELTKKYKYYRDKNGTLVYSQFVIVKQLEYEGLVNYWIFATNLKHSISLIKTYKQRWQIETDFRVHDEARIKSKSNIPIVRYFYFLTSLILMANWQVNRIEHPNVPFKRYLKNIEQIFSIEIT
jgi:IS4 transposase